MNSQVCDRICISHVDVEDFSRGASTKYARLHKFCQNGMTEHCEAMYSLHVYPLESPRLQQSNSSSCSVTAPHDIRVKY